MLLDSFTKRDQLHYGCTDGRMDDMLDTETEIITFAYVVQNAYSPPLFLNV